MMSRINKPYIIITSEILISWKNLKDRLGSYFSISSSERDYLYDKTKLLFKGLSPIESIVYDYRILLKRNFFEELYLNLDTHLLTWIEKNRDNFKFVLITPIKDYRAIFREHLRLFDKIFSSPEYNKSITDTLFLKIVFSYAYHDVQNPSLINIITGIDVIRKKFKEIDYNIKTYLVDILEEEEKTHKRIKDILEDKK